MHDEELEYVGFWARVGASLIDTVLFLIILVPIVYMVYGPSYWASDSLVQGPFDFLINYVFPAIAVIAFWIARQATPGKMAIGAKIVDSKTGHPASTGQLVGRYLGYYVSVIPLFLGIFWVAFDDRKQGWHDKLAGTVVIRAKNRGPKQVELR